MKRLLAVAFVFAVSFTLSACGNSFQPIKADGDGDSITGGVSPDGRPYTGLGDPVSLERVKRMVPQTTANRRLAQSLKAPKVSRLGADGKPTIEAPRFLEVSIDGAESSTLVFRVPVDGTGAKEVTQGSWTLSVQCVDADCETSEMKLSQAVGGSKSRATAAWVTTARRVRIEVLGPFTAKPVNAGFKSVLSELSKRNEATLVSHEIAWGLASWELKTRNMCFAGAALTTGDADAPASVGCEAPEGIRAALAGNSTRGDLLVRIDDGDAWAFIRVRGAAAIARPPSPTRPTDPTGPTEPTSPTTPPRPTEPGQPTTGPSEAEPGAILPIDLAHKVTAALEIDRTNAEIQERIRKWKKSTRLLAFLNRATPEFPAMLDAMKGNGVPAEIVFLTLLESNYFVCPGHPVAVSPVGAVGPWQFMPKTAAWDQIGLKVKPLIETGSRTVKGKDGKSRVIKTYRADTEDERGDLAKSTRGAAKYFNSLFAMFPSDPKLAIMAYNWGPGSVDKVLDCGNDATCLKSKLGKAQQQRLSEIQTAGFDYWTVRDLNMAPKESLEYVVDFLGAQFVGRNPERYGVKIPEGDFRPAELKGVCGY